MRRSQKSISLIIALVIGGGLFASCAGLTREEQILVALIRLGTVCVEQSDIASCRTACEAGLGNACVHLTDIVEPPMAEAARAQLEIVGCELGSAEGCYRAGQRLLDWTEARAAEPKAARLLFAVSCDRGYGVGCRALADCFRDGTGGVQDEAMATALETLACQLGDCEAEVDPELLEVSEFDDAPVLDGEDLIEGDDEAIDDFEEEGYSEDDPDGTTEGLAPEASL